MSFPTLEFNRNGECGGWVHFSDTEKEKGRLFIVDHMENSKDCFGPPGNNINFQIINNNGIGLCLDIYCSVCSKREDITDLNTW